jgi:tetratricopeptide (TPR) repeat protein
VALKFKLLGFPVVIGVDFFIVMLVLGALWRTPEQLPVWMIVVTGSVLLHEMGHATFFDLFGMKPVIQLYGAGGLTFARPDPNRPLTRPKHIVIAAAGPATGLIIGVMVGAAALAVPRIQSYDLIQDLLWVSLGWSLVNLLPLPGVDGGAIVSEVTSIVLRRPSEVAGQVVGLVLVGAIIVALLVAGLSSWAFIIGFFVVFNMARMGFGSFGGRASAPAGSTVAAAQLLGTGRYQEAFNSARLGMTDRPADPEAVLMASEALRLMARYADAETGYGRVLQLVPANARALRGRALARRRLGRTAESDADLAALLALPQPDAILSKAAALYDAERHEEGLRLVETVLPSAADASSARILATFAAMFSYGLGRPDEALRRLDAVLPATPDGPVLRELRALILVDLARFGEAIDDVRSALAAWPQHPSFLETLGSAVRISGDPAAAYQPLALSAETRPGDPRARAELALGQVQVGRLGEARAALETLPGWLSSESFVLYARAAVAVAAGASDEAVTLLAAAARLRPELGVRATVDPLFRNLPAR